MGGTATLPDLQGQQGPPPGVTLEPIQTGVPAGVTLEPIVQKPTLIDRAKGAAQGFASGGVSGAVQGAVAPLTKVPGLPPGVTLEPIARPSAPQSAPQPRPAQPAAPPPDPLTMPGGALDPRMPVAGMSAAHRGAMGVGDREAAQPAAPLSPAEQELAREGVRDVQVTPNRQEARTVGDAMGDIQERAQGGPFYTARSAPMRLSAPATPQQVASQTLVEPMTADSEELARTKQAAITAARQRIETYRGAEDSPIARDQHTQAAKFEALIKNAQTPDDVDKLMRLDEADREGRLETDFQKIAEKYHDPLYKADDISPEVRRGVEQSLGHIYNLPGPVPDWLVKAVLNQTGGLLSPQNVTLLPLLPESGLGAKAASGYFGYQGLSGASQQLQAAYAAHQAGNSDEAKQQTTEALISAIVGGAAALHAAGVKPIEGAYGARGYEAGGGPVKADVTYRPAYREPGPGGSYDPAEGSVVKPGRVQGGVTIAGRRFGTGEAPGEAAQAATAAPQQLGDGRPVMHGTDDVGELRASARQQAKPFGDAVAQAAEAVPGAEIDAVRDAKDANRITDKGERQDVAPSQVGDVLAAKVTVPNQQAAGQVLENLNQTLPVVKAEGDVAGQPGKNGVQQVQAIVQSPEAAGEPVKHAEVLLQTPEMAHATDQTHDDYRAQQAAEARGDTAEAERLKEKIAATHAVAAEAAQQRLQVSAGTPAEIPGKGGRGETSEQVAAPASQGAGAAATEKPRIVGTDGNAVELHTPGGKYPAKYRLVEADSLVPSHDAQSFAINAAYPAGVQERAYDKSKEAQMRVIEQAQKFEPSYVVNDNPDAVNGPPVITPDGMVLGGNSRAMSLQRLYAADGTGQAAGGYKDMLRAKAAGFGLQPEDVDRMQKPVLVREVAKPGDVDGMRRLGSDLNKSMTGGLSESEQAVSAGKSIKPETLEKITSMLEGGSDVEPLTLRKVMGDAKAGRDIVGALEEDGVLTARERPKYIDPATGGLNEAGKNFFEQALMGSILDDSRLMDRAPRSIVGKLESSLGSLSRLAARDDTWNLLPIVRAAVDEHAQIAKGRLTVEDHLAQPDMFRPVRNPVVDALVRTLGEKPAAVRKAFRAFAQDAAQDSPGQVRFPGFEIDPHDSFNSAFGTKLTARDLRDGLLRAMAGEGNEGKAATRQDGRPAGEAGAGRVQAGPAEGSGAGGAVVSEKGGAAVSGPGAPRPAEGRPGADRDRYSGQAQRTDGSGSAGETELKSRSLRGGDRVTAGGQPGTVEHFQPRINGGPERVRVRMDAGGSRVFKPGELAPITDKPAAANPSSKGGQWIGVDLDGTLAQYDGFKGPEAIGPPVEAMVERVKQMRAEGKDVRIFTARIADDPTGSVREAIEAWSQKHLGEKLPVTNIKDDKMQQIFDDRAVQVERNTGTIVGGQQAAEAALKPWGRDGEQGTGVGDQATRKGIAKAGGEGTPEGGQTIESKPAEGDRITGNEPRGTAETVSQEAKPKIAAKPARLPGETTEQFQQRLLAKGRFDKELSAARSRTSAQNAVLATLKPEVMHGKPTMVLNAAAYQTLARIFNERMEWGGIFLNARNVSELISTLRAEAAVHRGDGYGTAGKAVDALALKLDAAVDENGNLILLRADHDEPLVREELWHEWQERTKQRYGNAMHELAHQPEFEPYLRKVESIYGKLDRGEAATELVAKAMAGDPTMEWSLEDQKNVVREALKVAVDELGPDALENLPPMDPAVQSAVEEARAYAEEQNGRPGSQAQRGASGPAGGGAPEGGSLQGREVRGAGRSESAGEGGERSIAREGAGSPGARNQDGAVNAGAGRRSGYTAPEGRRPLFAPDKSKVSTVTTGRHEPGKPLDELIDDLEEMPAKKQTMAERVENATHLGNQKLSAGATGVEKAWQGVRGAMAGAWDAWNRPSPWSSYLQSLGDLRKAQFAAALQLDNFQKELKKTVPAEARRDGISVWIEANGDPGKLKVWGAKAALFKDKTFRHAFENAQHLTPQELEVAERGREYFRNMLKIAQDAGVLELGARNYITHMYSSDPETLERMAAIADFSDLDPNPDFVKRRVFASYFDAISAGERPRSMDFGKLLSAYHESFQDAFMTRSFLRSLLYGHDEEDGRPLAILDARGQYAVVPDAETSQIVKQPGRPKDLEGYRSIDAPQLRNFIWELTPEDIENLVPGYNDMEPEEQGKLFGPDDKYFPVPEGSTAALKGNLLIHPKYAGRVSDLVKPSAIDNRFTRPLTRGSALVKSIVLTGSLFHQTQIGVHAMEHMVNPFRLKSLNELAANKDIQTLVGHGLNLLNVDSEGVLSNTFGNLFAAYHRYLFRDFIPRIKATMALDAYERNLKRYNGKLTRDEIGLATAKQANAAFGGLDPAFFDKLYRMNNKTFKSIEHLALFSPDFTKARAQFVGQAAGKYGAEQRWALLRGALVLYAGARILNAVLNDGDAKWDPQDALTVVSGGRRFSLRTVQGDLINLVNDPRSFSYNRLNPITARPLVEYLSGRDQMGRQVTGIGHLLKEEAKTSVPIPAQKLFTTNDEGLLESMLTGMGIQSGKYRSPAENMAHRLRIQGIPDRPEDPAKQDEARANVQMVEKLREGKLQEDDVWQKVTEGKLSHRAASSIIERSKMTEFQYDVHGLAVEDALKVYEHASPTEKQELQPVLEAKRRGLKDKSADERAELGERFDSLGIN